MEYLTDSVEADAEPDSAPHAQAEAPAPTSPSEALAPTSPPAEPQPLPIQPQVHIHNHNNQRRDSPRHNSMSSTDSEDERRPLLEGRAPLLRPSSSGNVQNVGDARIEMPEDKPASPHDRFPKQIAKTLLLVVLVLISGFLNDLTLSFIHEWVPEGPPLPDLGFRITPYYAYGLNICEYLMLGLFFVTLLLILFHRHRWIVLRRLCFIGSVLYLCRCVTMFVTQVPVADPNYYCSPKLGENATFWRIAKRALEVAAGVGLKLYGKHTLCGDYIYSGHTIVLTVSSLFLNEYLPRRWKPLHYLAWLVSFAGMGLLIVSRGHYTLDIILSYFICTRVFWAYHTMAAMPTLRNHPHNHHRKVWWFPIFLYIEGQVQKPIPRRYDLPFPLPRKVAHFLRRRKINLQ